MKQKFQTLGQIIDRLIILLVLCLVFSACSQKTEPKPIQSTEPAPVSCIESEVDTLDMKSGGSGFFLYRDFGPDNNYVLVIRAKSELIKPDSCYSFEVNDAQFRRLSFTVFVDKYSGKGLKQMYEGCFWLANAETPERIPCQSGKLKFIMQENKDERDWVSLELKNAVFGEGEEKIVVPVMKFINTVLDGGAG